MWRLSTVVNILIVIVRRKITVFLYIEKKLTNTLVNIISLKESFTDSLYTFLAPKLIEKKTIGAIYSLFLLYIFFYVIMMIMYLLPVIAGPKRRRMMK